MPLQGLDDTPTLQLPQVNFMILATTDDPCPVLGNMETRADAVDVVLAAFVGFHASITQYVSEACSHKVIAADRKVA